MFILMIHVQFAYHMKMKAILQRYSNNKCRSRRIFRIFTSTYTTRIDHVQALKEAEHVVGCSRSYLNPTWLLNDKTEYVARQLMKLDASNPLLNTLKALFLGEQNLPWGLVVLLVSKAGGLGNNFPKMECDIRTGILPSQRILAEITEMFRAAYILHKTVQISSESTEEKNTAFTNKLAILSGDYLISKSFCYLSSLKCAEVNEIMASSLIDLVNADFIPPRDRLNQPLPAKPIASKGNFIISHPPVAEEIPNTLDVLGDAKREWTSRHLLGGATILGKSCQATLILAEHNKALQTAGYMFGCNLALAFQANLDHSIILHEGKAPFELICAPLMFHIQENSDFYDTLMENVENNTVDYRAIVKEVRSGSGLAKTVELKDEFALNASSILKSFPESRAKLVLSKFIKSLM